MTDQDQGRFRASGWRGREVALPRAAGAAGPVALEFKGGVTTSFSLHARQRSATYKSYGEHLCRTEGPGRRRVLVPAHCNNVEVSRLSPGRSSGSGFARWRLRVLDTAELSVLTETLSGRNEDVVYFAGSARFSFHWRGSGESGRLHFTRATGGEPRAAGMPGVIRGVTVVPGEGFLSIATSGPWTLKRL
ncbi:hypothetical protein ACIQMO_09915 [Streptomyces sp. NPDC091406]|uniref:hypothetical protein n=1 Tax=unclassified Streptomyces TaxID=2593676 RepID=UPI00380514C7